MNTPLITASYVSGERSTGEKGKEEKRERYFFLKKSICLFSPNMNRILENEFDFPA